MNIKTFIIIWVTWFIWHLKNPKQRWPPKMTQRYSIGPNWWISGPNLQTFIYKKSAITRLKLMKTCAWYFMTLICYHLILIYNTIVIKGKFHSNMYYFMYINHDQIISYFQYFISEREFEIRNPSRSKHRDQLPYTPLGIPFHLPVQL